MTALFFWLWYAAIALKSFAAFRLWRIGLIHRLPTVWVYMVVSVFRSLALAALSHDPRYAEFYSYSTPLMLLLEAFAIVGVFWSAYEYYPHFRAPGSALLTAIGLLAGTLSWHTRFVAVPESWLWAQTWQTALLLERYSTLVMILILLGSWALVPRISGLPIRASAIRAGTILALQVVWDLLGSAVTIWIGTKHSMFVAYIPVAGGLVSSALWATWLTARSDQIEAPAPVSEDEWQSLSVRAERLFAGLGRPRLSRANESPR